MFQFKSLPFVALLLSTVCAQAPKIRYMPFGDSITEIVCWRGLLWTQLQSAGFTNVDFVGSGTNQNPAGCPTATYDKDNEGHSGYLAIDIANKKQLVDWLKNNPADVITMHLGTNDIVQKNDKTADILAAFSTLIQVMRDSNPSMKIIVGTPFLLDFPSQEINTVELIYTGRANNPMHNWLVHHSNQCSEQRNSCLGCLKEYHSVSDLGCGSEHRYKFHGIERWHTSKHCGRYQDGCEMVSSTCKCTQAY
jgi:lysophospholipase L1-like esterase